MAAAAVELAARVAQHWVRRREDPAVVVARPRARSPAVSGQLPVQVAEVAERAQGEQAPVPRALAQAGVVLALELAGVAAQAQVRAAAQAWVAIERSRAWVPEEGAEAAREEEAVGAQPPGAAGGPRRGRDGTSAWWVVRY
jgi:hypothetical protein